MILPFDNNTGDENREYFVSGMHSSLINDMGIVSGLLVKSETTSKIYKNAGKSVPQIASELGVDAVVEAQVLCLGDTICLHIRVVAANPEEKLVWVGDYREDKSKILNLYNRVTKQIADEVKVGLTPEEEQLLSKSRIVDREAYDDYLKGYIYMDDLSPESLLKARDYLKSAIQKDPACASLYAALATVWLSIGTMGVESPQIAIPIVYENLNKALELDLDLAEIHYVSAFMAWTAEWDWEKAEKEFLKALSINPNHALTHLHYSHLLYSLQRDEEASVQANLGYKLDPLNPLIQTDYGWALLQGGNCESSLAILENILASDPDNFYANSVIQFAAFQCGDLESVFEAEKHLLPLEEEAMNKIELIYDERGFNAAYKQIMQHLEILAEKGYVAPADMAFRYYWTNQDDKAIGWIEKGAEVSDPSITSIGTGSSKLIRLYDNPRFIEVFKKMNLPLPDSD